MNNEYTQQEWRPPQVGAGACFAVIMAVVILFFASWQSSGLVSPGAIGQFALEEKHAYGNPLTLISPTKWETWEVGSVHTITWKGGDKNWPVSIYLVSENGMQLYRTLVENTANDGEEPWIVDVPARRYRVQLEACSECAGGSAWDMEHGSFTVPATAGSQLGNPEYPANTSLVVFSPTGGEIIYPTSQQTLRWYGGKPEWKLNLELISVDSVKSPEIIAYDVPNSGTYTWSVPSYIDPDNYYLKISCANCAVDMQGTVAYSFYDFTIKNP